MLYKKIHTSKTAADNHESKIKKRKGIVARYVMDDGKIKLVYNFPEFGKGGNIVFETVKPKRPKVVYGECFFLKKGKYIIDRISDTIIEIIDEKGNECRLSNKELQEEFILLTS